MKKTILSLSLLMSLGICAQDQSQLEQLIRDKKEQLDNLYTRIKGQEANVAYIHEKLKELSLKFKQEKIEELENKHPKRKINLDEVGNMYITFLDSFFENYFALNKTTQYLVNDNDSAVVRALKFYFLLYGHEYEKFKEMLQQLENLSDEIGRLEDGFLESV